ncbi:MAG: hypothetical protein ACFFCI_23950 [Promethearchaeota archaeon]
MVSERELSKRKTTQQTISISPALKARIEQYINDNNKKDPKDIRLKSVSSFYNYVLEKTMDCFDKGKTLDDFELFIDSEINDFFDKITFKALIPYYETALKTNKYTDPTFDRLPLFFLTIRRLYFSIMDPHDIDSINNLFSRLKNFMLGNSLTKDANLDLFTGKSETDLTGIFEFSGFYQNLSFENCKYTAAIFGLLGVKVTNCLYSEKDNYCRFDLEATELFYRKELLRTERIKLINNNVSQLINYKQIIQDDDDYFLWMKIADDKNIFISFNNPVIRDEYFNLIRKKVMEFSEKEEFHVLMLKLFEKLHWIDIESENELLFHLRLSETKNQDEIQFLMKILSEKSEVIKDNGIYYLTPK